MHVCIYGNKRTLKDTSQNKEKITKRTLFRRESVLFVVHNFTNAKLSQNKFTERHRGNINLVPILRLSDLFNKA